MLCNGLANTGVGMGVGAAVDDVMITDSSTGGGGGSGFVVVVVVVVVLLRVGWRVTEFCGVAGTGRGGVAVGAGSSSSWVRRASCS